jgi:hypothetical protein
MSIERLTLRTLLVALDRHDLDALAEDRSQLGIAELIDVSQAVDLALDGITFPASLRLDRNIRSKRAMPKFRPA